MNQPPAWLSEFQGLFTRVLRTPLDHSQGTLESRLPSCWNQLQVKARSYRSATAGVSDYHRQYWFRMLTILQKDFLVTARLLGLWNFNLWAQRYLLEVPPSGYDLGMIRQSFAGFLKDRGLDVMIVQAAQLDDARAALMMAPDFQAWSGLNGDHVDPERLRLTAAPHWRILHEDWALVTWNAGEEWPRKHEKPEVWLLQKDATGFMYRMLDKVQARLYELLTENTMAEALWKLQMESKPEAAQVQSWMALSVQWGLWAAE
jgi:hypothetical protein